MKIQYTRHVISSVIFILLSTGIINAQLCSNPSDTIYGLNSVGAGSGQIVGVNINDRGTTTIGSPASSSANANGIGFSPLNGNFYFFNQCGSGTTEFVSFNPITGTKVPLAIPSSPAIPTGQKIRSGTMTPDGVGYYTIYPGATSAQGFPVTGPAFFYYSVGSDSWNLVTQTFKDISGNTVNEIKNLNSGDMAFDGNGNLWMVVSNSAQYALYKITAPLPTSAVASITVDTIIAAKATPTGVSITGIGFNAAGNLYLCTGSASASASGVMVGDNTHNILYQMTTPSSPLVMIGEIPNGYGDDLTSCSSPLSVLASGAVSLRAVYENSKVNLQWQVDKSSAARRFEVEYSTDNLLWNTIAHIERGYTNTGTTEQFSFVHTGYINGNNYYRIKEISAGGEIKYSAVSQLVIRGTDFKFSFSPNPAKNNITLYWPGNSNPTQLFYIRVYDNAGRLCLSADAASQRNINIENLPEGLYTLQVISHSGLNCGLFRFVKQN